MFSAVEYIAEEADTFQSRPHILNLIIIGTKQVYLFLYKSLTNNVSWVEFFKLSLTIFELSSNNY